MAQKSTSDRAFGPFSTVAVSVKMSTLGAGLEVATPVARSFNLRGTVNFLNFTYPLTEDGTNYSGTVSFRSGEASLDWFPFHGGFHVSPGVLIFKSQIAAAANVPGGNSFELSDASYTSSATDPVHGSANILFGRTLMPALTVGFGNLIPRSGRHWSIPFEVGAAYMGHNTVQISLQGTACNQYGCLSVSDPSIQQNVVAAQADVNETMKHFQIYPILSTGFGYRF